MCVRFEHWELNRRSYGDCFPPKRISNLSWDYRWKAFGKFVADTAKANGTEYKEEERKINCALDREYCLGQGYEKERSLAEYGPEAPDYAV